MHKGTENTMTQEVQRTVISHSLGIAEGLPQQVSADDLILKRSLQEYLNNY